MVSPLRGDDMQGLDARLRGHDNQKKLVIPAKAGEAVLA